MNDSAAGASTPQIPGNRPYRKAGGAGLVPKADSKCTRCGLCAKNCPSQAINKENIKTANSKKCISCMRCVAKCTQSARKVNGAMVSAAAFAMKKACSARKENELYL
ncbi:MAG: 4Fe-4S binding protein [Lachnospiraceae bacterium]|nr:4Fe-4S binding protein [Lachnospiraceae bacterium]